MNFLSGIVAKARKVAVSAALIAGLSLGHAHAQPIPVAQAWNPQGKLASPVSVSNSSSVTQLPASGNVAWLCNTGSVDAYVAFGTTNSIAATATGSSWLKAGTCGSYLLWPLGPSNNGIVYTYVAMITATGTTSVNVETGTATPPSQGSGIGTAANPSTVTGNVGGYHANVTVTPTVQNAAYSSGNAIGGLQTVALFRTAAQPSAVLNNISVASKGGSTTALTLYIFD